MANILKSNYIGSSIIIVNHEICRPAKRICFMQRAIILFCISAAISSSLIAGPTEDEATLTDGKTTPLAIPNKKEPDWLHYFSGTVDAATNYLFRGVSQTRNLLTTQASLSFTTPMKIYFYFWGSNVSFPNSRATIELDTTLGYSNTLGQHFTYDLSVGRYNYPGAQHLSYNQYYALINYYFMQAAIGYSGNDFDTHRTGYYYNGGMNYDIPAQWLYGVSGINFLALFGHSTLPNAAGGSYNDYQVQLTKSINRYKLSIFWTSTNGRHHLAPYDGSQINGQLTAEF
jgi:uncharacterized protein (TIGR02001 family)